MDKEELKRLGQNPDFIKGIYNYCDRWCERCSFTSKCMLFSTEKKDTDDPGSLDLNNEAFWDRIAESFRLAHELLVNWAKEHGVDLDSEDSGYDPEEEKELDRKAETHPLAVKSNHYIEQVDGWMTSAGPAIEQKEIVLNKELQLEIAAAEPEAEAAEIVDLIEIVQWYQFQIHVKSMRALRGKEAPFRDIDPIQNDSNGSAKVALIGIERSMAAWSRLFQHFPELEDDTLPILVTLQQLNKLLNRTFPDVRKFKRPGFD